MVEDYPDASVMDAMKEAGGGRSHVSPEPHHADDHDSIICEFTCGGQTRFRRVQNHSLRLARSPNRGRFLTSGAQGSRDGRGPQLESENRETEIGQHLPSSQKTTIKIKIVEISPPPSL